MQIKSCHRDWGTRIRGTRTRSTQVLDFWYSYLTHTCALHSNRASTCARIHGQVLVRVLVPSTDIFLTQYN